MPTATLPEVKLVRRVTPSSDEVRRFLKNPTHSRTDFVVYVNGTEIFSCCDQDTAAKVASKYRSGETKVWWAE